MEGTKYDLLRRALRDDEEGRTKDVEIAVGETMAYVLLAAARAGALPQRARAMCEARARRWRARAATL